MEFNGKDHLKVKVELLGNNIIHFQVGGIDGYKASLLERYGIIEKLSYLKDNWQDQSLKLDNGYEFIICQDLNFCLKKHGTAVLTTTDDYNPGSGPTFFSNDGYNFSCELKNDEKCIGFGDQYRKGFLLNGQKSNLWIKNQTSYIPVPFYMSSKGYGIFFNTTRRGYFDFGVTNPSKINFAVEEDYLDIYIFTGESYDEMVADYLSLTGKAKLPPMYTFGLWMLMQGKIRVHELLQVAAGMRRAEVPCDILALEPGWMEEYYDLSVDKQWNKNNFPHYPWGEKRPTTFIGCLKKMGYRLGLWMCNDYDMTWEEERQAGNNLLNNKKTNGIVSDDDLELVEQDEHLGHEPMRIDKVTVPEEPFYKHLERFVDQGVVFFKQDAFAQVNEHPDRLYGNGRHDDEMHNINFLLYSKQMVEGYEKHTGKRGFTLTVAGWAGYQRYAGTWTGDTGGGAQPMCAMLQNAITGQPFVTCDVDVSSAYGVHMGFLLPWAEINSWAFYKYPIYQGEFFEKMIRDYSTLRMRMLPFWYSLARESVETGKAIMRPFPLVYPDKDIAYEVTHQYELGSSLLVSAYKDSVILPEGKWYDFWTGKEYSGNWEKEDIPYPENRGGHLLVKAGGILPLGPEMQYTGEKDIDAISWLIYPGEKQSSFTLYLDDGVSFNYRNGKYALMTLSVIFENNEIKIQWSEIAGEEPERIRDIAYSFELLGVLQAANILVAGEAIKSEINKEQNRTLIKDVRYGEDIRIML
jgi:alpha-glucosidase (family GH31 glycosyl hydrolase)